MGNKIEIKKGVVVSIESSEASDRTTGVPSALILSYDKGIQGVILPLDKNHNLGLGDNVILKTNGKKEPRVKHDIPKYGLVRMGGVLYRSDDFSLSKVRTGETIVREMSEAEDEYGDRKYGLGFSFMRSPSTVMPRNLGTHTRKQLR